MIIRKETEADYEAISSVTEKAFKAVALSPHTEQFIISALRADNALAVSLVAETEGQIVGHIAFSPVKFSDGSLNWYGAGPLSVLPEFQRKGIGKALMNEGLSILRSLNAGGCVLVGDPGYYRYFGFRNIPDLVYEGIPQEYFVALPFADNHPHGIVEFHKGFSAEC